MNYEFWNRVSNRSRLYDILTRDLTESIMKKILSLAFVLGMLLNATGNAAFAQFDGLSWFESMDNMQKLKSYSMVQVITGDAEGKIDDTKTASGNFSFNVKSDIVNRGGTKMDSKNIVDGKLHVALQGKDRPWSDMDVNFRLSVILIDKLGAYVRLENVNFNANGILKKDLQDYLDFKTQFDKSIDPIKWQWIHVPNQYLKGQVDQRVPMDLGGLDSAALKKDIAKNGFKKAIQKALKAQIDTAVKKGEMEQDEATKTRSLVDRFFKTEFFNLKMISKPGKEDSTTFSLNNNKILEFIRGATEELGEAISENDLATLQEALGKFNLTGSFHQNSEFGIFDRLKANLILKNVGGLSRLQVGYSSKIGNINTVEAIKPPAKSTELDDANLGFLPPATDTGTDSELNVEIAPEELEPLPIDGQ